MVLVEQYSVYWVDLNPTVGSEIKKVRPCAVISPSETNRYLRTVVIAPITSTIRNYPMRIDVVVNERDGQMALDQIRAIDKGRLLNRIGHLSQNEIDHLRSTLREFLVD